MNNLINNGVVILSILSVVAGIFFGIYTKKITERDLKRKNKNTDKRPQLHHILHKGQQVW